MDEKNNQNQPQVPATPQGQATPPPVAPASTPPVASPEVPQPINPPTPGTQATMTPPPASTPQPPAPPAPATAKKSGLSFFSTPMKVMLLVFLSVLLLGGFVITQKNKSMNTYNTNNTNAATKPIAVATTAPVLADVSPTVAGEIALEVTSPTNGAIVTSPNTVITGKTAPGADVMVNDATQKADAQGNFSLSVLLDEGDNILTITAVDPDGKYAEREYKITLNTNG